MIERIKAWAGGKLLPYWHEWYKHATMWLATIAAAIVSYLAAAPNALNDALNMLPRDVRDTLPAWIGPLVFFGLFLARFWDQGRSKPHG